MSGEDPTQMMCAAACFHRHETLAPACEGAHVRDRRDDRRGSHRPYAREFDMNRRALSSALTAAPISASIAAIVSLIASICAASGLSAARTASGTTTSPSSLIPRSTTASTRSHLRSLRSRDANLAQVSAQRIEKPRALTRKLLWRPVTHHVGLVLDRTNGDETLPRPQSCFADSRCVGCIILVASHIRLDMRRWDQLHLMTDLDQQATPIMRSCAGFHRDYARSQSAKKLQ